MIVDGKIRFSDVLEALGVSEVPDCVYVARDLVGFDCCVEVDEDEVRTECQECLERSMEEPHGVNAALVKDFVAAIHAGDMVTARCLVGRVFEIEGDVAEVDAALARRVA